MLERQEIYAYRCGRDGNRDSYEHKQWGDWRGVAINGAGFFFFLFRSVAFLAFFSKTEKDLHSAHC